MATYTADQAESSYPVRTPEFGEVAVAYGTYELTTAIANGDTVKLCKLPANCMVLGGYLYGDDLDTDATEALQLKWGTDSDDDAFLGASVVTGDAVTGIKPDTGIAYPAFATLKDGPLEISAAATVQVTCAASPTAGGTGTLSCVLYYTQKPSVGT